MDQLKLVDCSRQSDHFFLLCESFTGGQVEIVDLIEPVAEVVALLNLLNDEIVVKA